MEDINQYKSAYHDGYIMALNFAEINLMSLRVMVETGSWSKDELLSELNRMSSDIKELATEKSV
tara:strand:- start:1836 stop:2027 length:192 start_codon:yes stop_codon:yes gene_type:complete